MSKSFLHIIKLSCGSGSNYFNSLKAFYNNSIELHEIIFSFIDENIDKHKIQGKKVLIKPNWVMHSLKPYDELCLRTNNNFTISVLDTILKFKPFQVVIGDAPIQGCNWDKMISVTFKNQINKLSDDYQIPVYIKDFRRRVYRIAENSPKDDLKPSSDYVVFDIGRNSLLEPITESGKNKFRVTNYNPERMLLAHAPGIHKYCIVKELFNADIVFSLPKIKTHQKTGITGALKNLVGLNGDKDFLPHHRIGGTGFGGDCYPGNSYLRYWSELALDRANRNQGKIEYWFWQKISSLLWNFSFPGLEHNLTAGWHGNDTAWRMVLDLNKIIEFGKPNGTISSKSQRQIYSICDGIVGGQGDGPLNPEPLPLGIISITNNSLVNDKAMAILMNFPLIKIPLLCYPYSFEQDKDIKITLNNTRISLEDLKKYAVITKPPKGWINHFNEMIINETSNSPY